MMDDDDEFLYGPSTTTTAAAPAPTSAAPQPIPLANTQAQGSNGLVAHLEAQADDEVAGLSGSNEQHQQDSSTASAGAHDFYGNAPSPGKEGSGNGDEGEEEDEEEDESDDDVEIVMEAPSRTLDLRPKAPTKPSGPTPTGPRDRSNLTTEYTPIARGAPAPTGRDAQTASAAPGGAPAAMSSQSQLQGPSTAQESHSALEVPPFDADHTSITPAPASTSPQGPEQQQQQQEATAATGQTEQPDDGIDPSTLPPVKAPPSHPSIDPSEAGVYNGQNILEVDLHALQDKPWRRPGSDISDWFNYGFDEISWESYCYRRRDLGELAHVLKTNIINFSGMAEDQLTVLPPEVRGMVMTGANVAMNNAAQAQGMLGPNGMMMHDMGGMQGMGPMGGMGDISGGMGMMQGAGGQGMMGGMMDPSIQGGQGGMGMMQGGGGQGEVMPDGAYGGGGMGMGMNEYGMQDQQMVQGMYGGGAGMDVSQSAQGQSISTAGPARASGGAGAPSASYRASGARAAASASTSSRATRGSFPSRGRGGRGYDAPAAPARPASPLPPGVPTGPRNANKYKDRDGNAPAVDGLDYGGGKDGGSRRTPSYEPEERSSSRYSRDDRKRRSSPGLDESRSSKRR